ncbi:CHRD domain-containing protein [Brachybacterium tyrofermentans]|uniref:CHRD domain-containing protein n=2 Tax=Brachybacterium tyrofermentans TaxID=47848 RepID=UPI001D01AAC4|nr:CHRD domain-containing protein [Brachybacterium tyrofermentans]
MMRTTTKRVLPLFAATAMLGMFGASGAALAEGPDTTSLEANLTELNDSGASGSAWITLDGNEVTVKLDSAGLLAGAPHAQHIHIGGKNECPDPGMEGTGFEGAIRTTDAADSYGAVAVSLTNDGDTSPDSALAVDRFPAGEGGTYERTFEVSDDVAASLAKGEGSVVLHGVDHNGNGTYDGDQMSDLDESLPSEATDPAACGALQVSQMADMPEGGAETGDGTTAGIENAGMMVAGGGLIAAAFAGAVALRKRALQK